MSEDPVEEIRRLLGGRAGWTVAAAESLTAGHVQARLTSVSGSSAYFLGGLTAYTLRHKVALLGLAPELVQPCDGVSPEVAVAMASAACRVFGARLGVATTGYAEPAPARGAAAPFAYWAVADAGVASGVECVSRGRADGAGLGRTAMQAHVADVVVRALADYLSVAVKGENTGGAS